MDRSGNFVMTLTWTKTKGKWFASYGGWRAEIAAPGPTSGMYCWWVKGPKASYGSGGCSSAAQAKRSVEHEMELIKSLRAKLYPHD
jgi:hypothetical protein